MKINRLFLRNIRSYTEQELHFPEGSILLSGNIGCGKSTVLLAMDFALFGLQRGNLTGAALLRNGTDKGEVELDFEIDDKKVTIKRCLKRSKNSVGQEAGSITINGEYQDGTAIELKQKVLELLNYPKDLLTKNKSLVFRYTVYTPQEEMKQILLGDKNDRLETLRKVFGIDKYKRIKENTKIILSKVREKKREYTGYTSDLNEKNLMLIQKQDEVRLIETKVKEIEPLVENQVKIVEDKKNQIKDSEEKIKQLTELKNEFELAEVNRTHKLNEVEKTIKDIEKLNLEVEELQKESLEGNPDTIKDLIEEKNNKLLELETKIKQYSNLMQDIKTKKQVSDEVKLKIQELSSCPMCHQEVSHEHKSKIVQTEDEKVSSLLKDLEQIQTQELIEQQLLTKIKEELEVLRRREQDIALKLFKKKSLEEKQVTLEQLNKTKSSLNMELMTINIRKTQLQKDINELKEIENQYQLFKNNLDKEEITLKQLEQEKITHTAQLKPIQDSITQLSQEIEKKLSAQRSLTYLNQLQLWLEEHFINLMGEMEKNIMYKVHADFNSLFEQWFTILINNPQLKISLDEEFSPKIEQDGYDIEYTFLSGGEKTAAALAYRLALNQVINNTMTTIKTNDLLILDEPTDGFSSEQLDRLRIVLEELKLKQILIVSHEAKIESFVDSVMRFEKKEHTSQLH